MSKHPKFLLKNDFLIVSIYLIYFQLLFNDNVYAITLPAPGLSKSQLVTNQLQLIGDN